MLETIAIPVLLKAVEALFGEGAEMLREIIQEQRKHQQGEGEIPESTVESISLPEDKTEATAAITSKEDALRLKIEESAWANMAAEVKHLVELWEIYRENYRHYARQAAIYGGERRAPVNVVHGLKESKNQLVKTMVQLQKALKRVYGRQVVVSEVEKVHALFLEGAADD